MAFNVHLASQLPFRRADEPLALLHAINHIGEPASVCVYVCVEGRRHVNLFARWEGVALGGIAAQFGTDM